MFSKNVAILTLYILPTFSLSTLTPPITIHKTKDPTPGHMVALKDGVSLEDHIETFHHKTNGTSSITHKWGSVNGFAGIFSAGELEYLQSHPDVDFIEENGQGRIQRTKTR